MKKALLAAFLSIFAAQAQDIRIPATTGGQNGWILRLDSAQFLATVQPDGSLLLQIRPITPQNPRIFGLLVLRTTDGTYPLPPKATNVEVFVNGLHYFVEEDYSIVGNSIVPKAGAGNWPQDAKVRVNYDPVTSATPN